LKRPGAVAAGRAHFRVNPGGGDFMLPNSVGRCNNLPMPRRVKQGRPFWAPVAENFRARLASGDSRLRRQIVRYGLWVVGGMFVWSLAVGEYSIPRIIRLHLEHGALLEANRQYTVALADAARIRHMLETDPSYLEYIARTRYRMVRPNEVIYRYRGQ